MSLSWFEGRWLWPSVALFAAISVFLIWSYSRNRRLPPWARAAACTLKLLGFAALFLFLLDPQIRRQIPKPGTNIVVLAGDTSASMSVQDQADGKTRAERMAALLSDPALRDAIRQRYQILDFTFDSGLNRTGAFPETASDIASTSIHGAVDRLLTQMSGQPLAAIVLVTDGAATDSALPLPPDAPPVFPVILDAEDSKPDAGVENVRPVASVFENAPVTLDAVVRTTNAVGRKVTVRVLDADGQPLLEEKRTAGTDVMGFRFLIPADKAADPRYTVRVEMEGDTVGGNNSRTVVANRESGPYRALYVSGQPNWEHKFLQRALAKDTDVKLVSLIRVARGEAKFDWRAGGGGGDSQSHPFFQGQKDDDEAERYDEPVFLRIGTRDSSELRDGFPTQAQELFGYDLLILDGIEADFFSPDQLSLIRRFVAERGGSLLVLGGIDSLESGGYERTPLADALPVYLNGAREPEFPLRVTLTDAGMLEPWARLRKTETDEKDRLEKMPAFEVGHELPSLKPGAQAIATVEDAAGATSPAIAVQKFGKGRSMAMLVGDWWRWGMQDPEHRRDFETFWRQAVRGLMADVPRRAAIEATAGDPAKLTIRALDADYRPSTGSTASLRVRAPGEGWVSVETPPAAEPGEFTAEVAAQKSGAWSAEAVVTDPSDGRTSKITTGWAVNHEAEEFQPAAAGRTSLAALAEKTGGRLLTPGELGELPQNLKTRPMPAMETRTEPLWNHAGWLLAALACFAGEWALRRWKGLP